MSRRSSLNLCAAFAASLLSGCFIGSGPLSAPAVPLEPAEQRQVVACQQKIANEVRQLQLVTYKQLSRCLQLGVDLALEEERELTSATIPEYFERRQRTREKCSTMFETVGRASTKMIDAVLAKCGSVEAPVLVDTSRGDPLGMKAVLEGPTTMEDVAGQYCGVATSSAELLVSAVYPRLADLSWRYYHTTDDEEMQSVWRVALDPRCPSLLGDLGS